MTKDQIVQKVADEMGKFPTADDCVIAFCEENPPLRDLVASYFAFLVQYPSVNPWMSFKEGLAIALTYEKIKAEQMLEEMMEK